MKIIFAALLHAFLMISCHQTGHDYYSHELEKIDHRQNRELAKKEVVAIKDEIARQSEDLRMYYLLLLAEMSDEIRPPDSWWTIMRILATDRSYCAVISSQDRSTPTVVTALRHSVTSIRQRICCPTARIWS